MKVDDSVTTALFFLASTPATLVSSLDNIIGLRSAFSPTLLRLLGKVILVDGFEVDDYCFASVALCKLFMTFLATIRELGMLVWSFPGLLAMVFS